MDATTFLRFLYILEINLDIGSADFASPMFKINDSFLVSLNDKKLLDICDRASYVLLDCV